MSEEVREGELLAHGPTSPDDPAVSREERLARYSRIQTVTAIISVCLTGLLTVAAVTIAGLQWMASERQVTLEYAKSQSRHNVRQLDEAWDGSPPDSLEIVSEGGDVQFTQTRAFLKVEVGPASSDPIAVGFDGPSCTIFIAAYWPTDRTGATTLRMERSFTGWPAKSEGELPAVGAIKMAYAIGDTIVERQYLDVFGKQASDLIELERSGAVTVRYRTSLNQEFIHDQPNVVRMDSIGNRLIAGFQVQSGACQQAVASMEQVPGGFPSRISGVPRSDSTAP